MSDISQTLGFDASQALASLSVLNGALTQFEASLQRTATALRDFNTAGSRTSSLLSRLGSSATGASQSLNAVNVSSATSSFASLGAASAAASAKVGASSKTMQADIGRLTTSTQLLSRIAFTQFAIRGLNTIRRQFEDAATGAVDFQRQVALISTIDNTNTPFEKLASNVRSISDNFNLPLLQTASGLYQTLSNQVGDLAQSQEFLTVAAKFAKSTNSSLKDSVDLLSAAMKSYGLTVNDTDKIATSFFKAIDLGRLEADALANSMGRILPITAALGISLDETNAALAAVSIKGSGSSESITQLRSVVTAFLKPSDVMKAALKELGVSSSDLLIQEVGLAGALRLVTSTTDGSKQAMAALFPNVRGLAGATNLTADGMREMASTLDQTTAASRNFASQKYLQATTTDAERVTKEINKLKNAFAVDLGQSILKAGADLSQFVGGADKVAGAVSILGPAIAGLGGSFLTLRARSLAADAGLKGIAKTLTVLAAAELAFGGGKSIGDFLENIRSKNTLAPLEALSKSNEAGLKTYKAQLAEATDSDNKADQVRLKSALAYTRSLNQVYQQQQDNLAASNKVIKKLQGQKNLTPTQAIQLSQARQTVRNAPNPLAGVPGLDQLSASLGKQFNTPDQLSRGLIDAEKRIEQLRSQIDEAQIASQKAVNLNSEINSIFGQIGQRANARESVGSINAPALNEQFNSTVNLFKEVQKDGKVTEGELNVLIDLTNKFRENATGGSVLSADRLTQRLGFSSSIELLDQALQKMSELSKAPTINIAPLQTELQQLDGALLQFSAQLDAGVSKSAAIASNFERIQQAAAQTRVPGATAQVQGLATGGYVNYFAEGGFAPRGTDTIPAMLSPGEFVVNAAATRKFYSQLVAINSGRSPIYRAEGGPTNHVTFSGDINVVENNNGQDTARNLMNSVRRELRRSTGRI